MIVKKYSLQEFRKRYNNSEDFIIRIRDKEIEEKRTYDIIYYNGIKAFIIDNEKSQDNNVFINLSENIYKLNRSNILNILGPKKDKTKISDLLSGIYDVRSMMQKYVPIHLNTIKLKTGSAYFKGKNYLKVQENVFKILEKINLELKKYDLEINPQKIVNNIEEKCTKKLQNVLNKYPKLINDVSKFSNVYEKINYLFENHYDLIKNIDFKVTVDTNLKINKSIKDDLEIEKIFVLNTIFTDELKYDKKSGFSIPEFEFKNIENENLNSEVNLDDFDEAIKLAIQNYEEKTGEELEKKYQHQFMLNSNVLKKFSNLGIVNLLPFEEEYYIKEGKDEENNGRLDCIFIRPEKTEVYLIELKVNDSVIGEIGKEEHGINKHLEDIIKLCSNKEKLDEFLTLLIKRFNNTQNKLYGNKNYTFDIDKVKVYFYTIIAITPDVKNNAQSVIKKIKNLYEEDKENLTLLNPQMESVTIANCEMKILFDIWDKEINEKNFMSYQEVIEKFY